jgi:8-oxo-dGTP pyrophosphatase MutT (NUDIX family)
LRLCGESTVSLPDPPQQHAAGIIPIYPGGAIVLQLRDNRHDVAAPNCWSTIGGHIEPGETPAEAAAREMEEETGRRPVSVTPAGFIDHPSSRGPGIIIRSHIFATTAPWTLDEMILGEGQRIDWFIPDEVPALRLGSALAPAVLGILGSEIHRSLAGDTPPVKPPLSLILPETLADDLGLIPGCLVAVEGISAGFIRRLADIRPDVRVTASPSDLAPPDIGLWQPRRSATDEDYARWRANLPPGGVLWQVAPNRDDAGIQGGTTVSGFNVESRYELPGGCVAWCLRRTGQARR